MVLFFLNVYFFNLKICYVGERSNLISFRLQRAVYEGTWTDLPIVVTVYVCVSNKVNNQESNAHNENRQTTEVVEKGTLFKI